MYGDGMDHPEADGLVPPGKMHVYTWFARRPDRARRTAVRWCGSTTPTITSRKT